MEPTSPRDDETSGTAMPDDLRDLLAALGRSDDTVAPGALLDLTRRIRAAAHRELPAHSLLRHSIDSEDLMQETIADLVRAAPEFRGRTWGGFFGFTLKLLERRKIAHARRARVRRGERTPVASASQIQDRHAPSPSAALAIHEDAKKAATLLRELASPYRETLELKLRGLATDAIAQQLGANEATVRKRIARALDMLKAKW